MNIAEIINEVRGKATTYEHAADRVSQEIIDRLTAIQDATDRAVVTEQYRYVYDGGLTTAVAPNDTVSLTLGGPAQGSAWIIERLAATGGSSGAFAVYLGEIQAQSLVGFHALATIGAWDEINGIYVPAGRTVIAHFYDQGFPAGGQYCSLNARVRELNYGD